MTTTLTLASQNSHHLTHPKYRADIDGLRAIAVLAVVCFHAFPNTVKGGFIGVDIFFVISGFLISTIIFSNLETGNFSFIEFYSRRIKRIFPALLLVLITSLTVGWLVLLNTEFKQLCKHIAGGASFVYNFVAMNESGYFDKTVETKPLVHLWSLGIEEQFYIFWPLLLWFFWKQKINLLIITLSVLVISFALNIDAIYNDPIAAFYLPQTRFWELLTGSVLAYTTLYKPDNWLKFSKKLDNWLITIIPAQAFKEGIGLRDLLSLLGVTLITIGIVIITKKTAFPGWWALLPTLGSILIISAGSSAWLNRVLLSNRLLVWFGLISYPLYLWHWSLLSFAHIMIFGKPSLAIRIAAVFISIVLAWLTYRLIEKPIRFGEYSKTKTITLIVLMVIVGLIGYNGYKQDKPILTPTDQERQDFEDYFDNSYPGFKYFKTINIFETYNMKCNFWDYEKFLRDGANYSEAPRKEIDSRCFERNNAYNRSVMIWGDSHAQHLYYGLKHNLPSNWQILQVASSSCHPDSRSIESDHANSRDIESSTTNFCTQSNWFALQTMQNAKPDVVIIAQGVGHNIDVYRHTIEKLKSFGIKKIIVLGPVPHWTAALPAVILKVLWAMTPRRTHITVDKQVLTDNALFQKNFTQTETVIFANLIDFFCNKDGCLTYIGNDKKTGLVTFDEYAHLSPVASDYLAKNLLVNLIVGNDKKNQ